MSSAFTRSGSSTERSKSRTASRGAENAASFPQTSPRAGLSRSACCPSRESRCLGDRPRALGAGGDLAVLNGSLDIRTDLAEFESAETTLAEAVHQPSKVFPSSPVPEVDGSVLCQG